MAAEKISEKTGDRVVNISDILKSGSEKYI